MDKLEYLQKEILILHSLESIRDATMEMKTSRELNEVVAILNQEISKLHMTDFGCNIQIMHDTDRVIENWLSVVDINVFDQSFFFREEGHPTIQEQWHHWDQKTPHYSISLSGDKKRSYDDYLFTHTDFSLFPEAMKAQIRSQNQIHFNCVSMRYGNLIGIREQAPFTDGEFKAQAREAQIEAALERIRAASMAMHHSEELANTAQVLYEQFRLLGENPEQLSIGIINEEEQVLEVWLSMKESRKNRMFKASLDEPAVINKIYRAWKEQAATLHVDISGAELQQYQAYKKSLTDFKEYIGHKEEFLKKEKRRIIDAVFFRNGALTLAAPEPQAERVIDILKRFTAVFDMAYTRFLDLIKAEERAREAEVEASLERVRAKAMAMHHSEDLSDTVGLLLHELEGLHIHPVRCGFGRVMESTQTSELYIAQKTDAGQEVQLVGTIPMEGHLVIEGIFEAWKNQEAYLPVLKGKLMTSYYQKVRHYLEVEVPPKGSVQYGYFNWYQEAGLYAWSETPYDPDTLKIYDKFTAVLGLTFNRYQDLVDAEARALEARREASLDRLRAEIASMRTSKDLERITPLIWKELITLEVPFFRCGVFIVNEEEEMVQTYLSTPQGESLAALNLPFSQSEFIEETVTNWRSQKIYTHNWDRAQFMEFTQSIIQQGLLENAERYQGGETPPEKLALHFVPFAQGMLYVGSEDPLSVDQLELVQSLADAFSVAYSRYEDYGTGIAQPHQ